MVELALDEMSLDQLKQLERDVRKAIVSYEERKLAEARTKVEDFARDLGFTLDEITSAPQKSKRSPSLPKYRHPENQNLTWSGRGRKPKWLIEMLEAGTPLDDLVIS